MAKNDDIFSNMNISDMSYLLDPVSTSEASNALDESGSMPETIVPLKALKSFKDHPFRVDTEGEDFQQLVDSIRENGLIYPILVRPSGELYEIIAGHRRAAACEEAGILEVPVIIRDMDDFDATILMVHSNFYRDKILISEKARAYRMCMDAEKHQGKKGVDTAVLVGKEHDSRRQVYRYIRLSYLSNEFLEMLDLGRIPVNVGVELSYLDEDTQSTLIGFINEYHILPNIEQANSLHKRAEESQSSLSYESIVAELVTGFQKKSSNSVSFKKKDLRDFFDENADAEYMYDVIIKLLQKFKNGEVGELD